MNKEKNMGTIENSSKEDIDAPHHIDILLHLQKNPKKDDIDFVGIILQYNIAATGPTPEIALEKAVRLASIHFNSNREDGIDVYRKTTLFYSAAFLLGRHLPKMHEDVQAKMSMELVRYLGSPTIDIRSICDLQQRDNLFDIEQLARNYYPELSTIAS
jgi:hypothetical protein